MASFAAGLCYVALFDEEPECAAIIAKRTVYQALVSLGDGVFPVVLAITAGSRAARWQLWQLV